MPDDVTPSRVLQDLRRRWKEALVVAAAVVVGAVLYAQSLPNEYEGKAVVAFSPRAALNIGADTVRVVMPKYVAYATSRATVNRVAAELGEDSGELAKAVDASVEPDSGNLTVKVTLTSARRAAEATNALADDILQFADTDDLLDAVVVAPALPPRIPSGPPRRLFAAAAVVLGTLLGLAMAFLLERGRPRVRTWRDVAIVTGYPVVGRVPPARVLRAATVEALADPAVGASVRTLRTNLERVSRELPVHVLVVTSSVSGEGKTTLAASLAVALSRLEANVLLVDADLRRPGVAKLFGMKERPGLSELLQGSATLEECLRPGPVPALHVVPTAVDADAGDLLARRFVDVLRAARERFDVVVVDAPPMLGGDDARTIATMCDGTLFVVGADTPATSVSEAANALDALGVRVLGAVANRMRDPRGLGSYGAYGTYGAVPSSVDQP